VLSVIKNRWKQKNKFLAKVYKCKIDDKLFQIKGRATTLALAKLYIEKHLMGIIQ